MACDVTNPPAHGNTGMNLAPMRSSRLTPASTSPSTGDVVPTDCLGSVEWLERLYERHACVVFRYATSRCGSEAAGDVVADTFVEAARNSRRFDPAIATERAWLLGIATNLIRRRARHARRLTLVAWLPDRGRHDAAVEHSADRLDASRARTRLTAAVAALPRGERDAFLLHALGELDGNDIAAALAISPGAAKVRVHRARTRLRRMLADLGEGEISTSILPPTTTTNGS